MSDCSGTEAGDKDTIEGIVAVDKCYFHIGVDYIERRDCENLMNRAIKHRVFDIDRVEFERGL